MYIPESAVDATLRAVVRIAAPGSQIVFDYFLESALQARASALREIAKNVAAVGEPFVFGVPGQDGSAFVQARGLRVVSDFGSGDLGARYLPKNTVYPRRRPTECAPPRCRNERPVLVSCTAGFGARDTPPESRSLYLLVEHASSWCVSDSSSACRPPVAQ